MFPGGLSLIAYSIFVTFVCFPCFFSSLCFSACSLCFSFCFCAHFVLVPCCIVFGHNLRRCPPLSSCTAADDVFRLKNCVACNSVLPAQLATAYARPQWHCAFRRLKFSSVSEFGLVVIYSLSRSKITGWWFGTLFIFPYIGNNHPN